MRVQGCLPSRDQREQCFCGAFIHSIALPAHQRAALERKLGCADCEWSSHSATCRRTRLRSQRCRAGSRWGPTAARAAHRSRKFRASQVDRPSPVRHREARASRRNRKLAKPLPARSVAGMKQFAWRGGCRKLWNSPCAPDSSETRRRSAPSGAERRAARSEPSHHWGAEERSPGQPVAPPSIPA